MLYYIDQKSNKGYWSISQEGSQRGSKKITLVGAANIQKTAPL